MNSWRLRKLIKLYDIFLSIAKSVLLIPFFSKPTSVESDLTTSNSKALQPPTPSPEYSHSLVSLPSSRNGLSSSGKAAPRYMPLCWYSSFSHYSCLYSRQPQLQRRPYYALWIVKLPSWSASSGTHHSILPKRKTRLFDMITILATC